MNRSANVHSLDIGVLAGPHTTSFSCIAIGICHDCTLYNHDNVASKQYERYCMIAARLFVAGIVVRLTKIVIVDGTCTIAVPHPIMPIMHHRSCRCELLVVPVQLSVILCVVKGQNHKKRTQWGRPH